jgi:3-(methylthio)propanoyl-CoA dehydrogenase
MFSLVTAGWLMARQALVATAALDGAEADSPVLEAKIGTARFFCEQLLPAVHGLAPAATASADVLFALDPARLGG